MDKYLFFVFTVFLANAFANGPLEETSTKDSECSECNLSNCPSPGICYAGIAEDRCGCCQVCALEEGQLCDYIETDGGRMWQGFCGYGMECRPRKDIDLKKVLSQSICVCEKEGLVCGTDKITYSQCSINAAEKRSNGEIKKEYDGPCLTQPKVLTHSENEAVKHGSKHTIMCEVLGHPIPKMEWLFHPANSQQSFLMPGDSEEVSVSVRGGPEKMRVTGFLQITNFQQNHEGIYECRAMGTHGDTSAKISLVYKQSNDL